MCSVCAPSASDALCRTEAGTVPHKEKTEPPPGAAGVPGGLMPGGLATGIHAAGVTSGLPYASMGPPETSDPVESYTAFDPPGVSTRGVGMHVIVTSMQYSAPVTMKLESEAPAMPRITRSVLGAFCGTPFTGAPPPWATSVGRKPLVGLTCVLRPAITGPVALYVNTSPETTPHDPPDSV